MATGASTPDLSQVSEVLEVATSILQRHRDEHLSKKTLIMQGFLDMSQRYPERDYRTSIDRALAELTGAVHLHLNAELHTVTALFARLVIPRARVSKDAFLRSAEKNERGSD